MERERTTPSSSPRLRKLRYLAGASAIRVLPRACLLFASRSLVPLFCLLTAVGCNALLGTEDGTAKAAPEANEDGGPSVRDTDDDDDDDGKPNPPGKPDSETPRDDSKPPCENCSASKVATVVTEAKNIQVHGNYVYFTDASGSYRIDWTKKEPCTGGACKEVISNMAASSVAASDSHVCWVSLDAFGCAKVDDLTNSHVVSRTAAGLTPFRLAFEGETLYGVQGDSHLSQPAVIVRGDAVAVAAGSGTFVSVTDPTSAFYAFALSATNIAWSEDTNLGSPVKTKPTKGGSVTPIPLPLSFKQTYSYVRDVALYGTDVLISPYAGANVYRAPADGSAEAKPLFSVSKSLYLAAHSSGVYVAFGDLQTGGVAWSSHSPGAGAKAKVLTSVTGEMTSVAVADSGIFYGVHGTTAGSSGIWRIEFE